MTSRTYVVTGSAGEIGGATARMLGSLEHGDDCRRLAAVEGLLALLDSKPYPLHLILTGRNAHPEVIKRAHLVTEMTEIKHPYQQGILAQKGIDF